MTAAHVLDKRESLTLYAYRSPNLFSLNGWSVSTPPPSNDRDADRIDIAIYRVPAEDVQLLSSATAIQVRDFSKDLSTATSKSYAVLGYPYSKNKRAFHRTQEQGKMKLSLAAYGGNGVVPSEDEARRLNLSPQQHLLIDHAPKKLIDGKGEFTNSLGFPGMSGGAVFSLGNLGENTNPSPTAGKLAAIMIEHHAKPALVVTVRIDLIAQMIRAEMMRPNSVLARN